MRLYKRGKYYWFQFIWNGKTIRESSRVSNRRDAADIASARRTALAKGEAGIKARKPIPDLPGAMKSFLEWSASEHKAHPATARRHRISSVALLRFFGKVGLDQITTEDVERFKTERLGETGKRTKRKLRPATVNRELACLRALFNFAIKGETLVRNPVSFVKFLDEQNEQERVLTYREQRAYLAVATPMLRDVAGMILELGLRPDEVYSLERSSVDLARGYLKVIKGKTKAAKRRVELTDEARRILTARMAAKGSRYLFPCETDAARPIPKVNNAHDRAVRDSGVPAFRLYDCRHTWGTRAAEAGVDLVTLAAMMGHSRIQQVMRYCHPTQKHQTSATEKVALHNRLREQEEENAEGQEAARSTPHVIGKPKRSA